MKKSLFILLLFFSILICFNQDWYRMKSRENISATHLKTLKKLGIKALENEDIPVSSILLYKNKIIGQGFNTVVRDNNAAGHAEINAISNAIENVGIKKFNGLNRDSIKLITTYEPCLMCKGAIISYRINDVVFIQKKSLKEHFNYTRQNLWYELNKNTSQKDSLQIKLFELHPNYPKN